MRYYEWKQYRDKKVVPLTMRCYEHELYCEAASLITDIDRAYRMVNYTKSANKRDIQQKIVNRRTLDQKWLEHDIKSKLAYLEDILIIMRLGT